MKIYIVLTASSIDSPIRVFRDGTEARPANGKFSIVNKDGHFLDLSYDALRALGNGWHEIPAKIPDADDLWENALDRGIQKATAPKD